ncbi:PP2C family protein-serine/threonine phosphatase [Geodermatophilus sp. DSM 45219]|uniref:PP2C family protein-serine/threonine phosphatase n=1 Tax=Geodermatophilus sp. DSM 45219 TaxID=1881103 RepID=UPI00088B98A8|nr:PP2C family protein-serine/threonine phosphatase [Geodermatophilus sp. DSM 45219]SDO53395.1 Stage II sporulation protein E (SpoIIE) [Geodermatophilus sp. DSM 45219]
MTRRPGPGAPEDPSEEERRHALRSALEAADLTLDQLWTRYFAIGGHADLFEVEGHLQGLLSLPPAEVNVLAHALNERLDELVTQHRVPYLPPVRRGRTRGPFATLLRLVETAHLAPPDRLPALVGEAGAALGVEVTVHVADHEQRRLWPLRPAGPGSPDSLPIDGSLPGRVFQSVRLLPSDADGVRRLWLPLLDGSDRIGVLEVRVGTESELYDPGLREECRWLAELVGSLLASMGQYGDGLERPRRTRPRTASAELLWQLLPPLTAGSGTFVLSGVLEPAYEAGGDAFDYSLSDTTVSLAAFDAMGHGLAAALLAAAAVSAYRSARRDGRGVYDQARAIDEVVADTFPGSAFVTGVLAELDVPSGRLRYVNAGHPTPYLLRGGKVVKSLAGGRRRPFGLGTGVLTVAEEALQPGDWLAVHTDGVTEARDATGAWFGEERLVDLLTREVAGGQTPPETARRLMHAVLDHQDGLLQDDASVLLARWAPEPRGL